MLTKLKEKETAIELRKQGYSYSEILKKVPVAKSTLSLWLRSVGLAERQKQRLTEKKRKGQLKGAQTKKR
jgi:transposase